MNSPLVIGTGGTNLKVEEHVKLRTALFSMTNSTTRPSVVNPDQRPFGSREAGGAYEYPPASLPLWPPGFVTTTSTVAAAWAEEIAVIVVLLTTATDVVVPSSVTVAPAWNAEPVMVTGVPPDVVPMFGEMVLTVGGGTTKAKPPLSRALWPLGLVTTTSTVPAPWAGVVAVMEVLLTTLTLVGAPSSVTVAPDWKPVPVIVTGVPPPVDPVLGEMPVTVGAAEVVD